MCIRDRDTDLYEVGEEAGTADRHASDRACAEKTAGRIFGGLWRLELRTAGGTCDAWDRCVDTGGKLPYNCDCEGEKTGQITIFSLKFFQ